MHSRLPVLCSILPNLSNLSRSKLHLRKHRTMSMATVSQRPTIVVAVCTYNRNGPLSTLLEALLINAKRLAERAAVGVVVVDDSADGKAREVVNNFEGRFELGIVYRISGRQNISIARNLAIETASGLADWTAMTDDDCEPVPEWLAELLDMQQRTGADAVTGPMVRRVPPDSPRWLSEEPFLTLGVEHPDDGAEVTSAATFNSMISSRWLKEHPEIRFQPSSGVIGGEDVVFYRSAHAAGLRIRHSERAFVYENEPPSRATFAYQLRLFFWHGNSSYLTSVGTGVPPTRMVLHGANSMRKALVRPIIRISRGQRPQLRYCLASVLHAIGKMSGPLGVRVYHR
jgi:glycosyltransferase involved in cell wall biosynthesis